MKTHEIKDELDSLRECLETNPPPDSKDLGRCLDRIAELQWEYTERLDKLMGR